MYGCVSVHYHTCNSKYVCILIVRAKNKKGKLLWEYVKLDSKTYFTIASYSISIIKLPVIYIIKTFLLKIIILNESLQILTPIN